ncbi:MAG: hypothetical protein ACP5DY_02020 [Thermovirgaceae bacterium]
MPNRSAFRHFQMPRFCARTLFVCRKRQLEEDYAFYQDQKKAASLIADGSLVEIIENTLDRLE